MFCQCVKQMVGRTQLFGFFFLQTKYVTSCFPLRCEDGIVSVSLWQPQEFVPCLARAAGAPEPAGRAGQRLWEPAVKYTAPRI